ncbi:MAG: hypothetical protein AAF311_16710 [Pseudomonadota bacterium]
MSYQFDDTQLKTDRKVRLNADTLQLRLLARRTSRQMRRSNRAI